MDPIQSEVADNMPITPEVESSDTAEKPADARQSPVQRVAGAQSPADGDVAPVPGAMTFFDDAEAVGTEFQPSGTVDHNALAYRVLREALNLDQQDRAAAASGIEKAFAAKRSALLDKKSQVQEQMAAEASKAWTPATGVSAGAGTNAGAAAVEQMAAMVQEASADDLSELSTLADQVANINEQKNDMRALMAVIRDGAAETASKIRESGDAKHRGAEPHKKWWVR